MNQTSNSASSRGDRPQLFGAARAADQHIDFGPSILSTIDGGESRSSAPRSRFARKSVLWLGGVALLLAVVYALASTDGVAASAQSIYALFQKPAAAAEPKPAVRTVSVSAPIHPLAVADIASASGVHEGAAAIETVVQPAMASPSVSNSPVATPAVANVAGVAKAAGVAGAPIETAGAASAVPALLAVVPSVPRHPPVQNEVREAKARAEPRAATSKQTTVPSPDNDAELLAAMLPHLHGPRRYRCGVPGAPFAMTPGTQDSCAGVFVFTAR